MCGTFPEIGSNDPVLDCLGNAMFFASEQFRLLFRSLDVVQPAAQFSGLLPVALATERAQIIESATSAALGYRNDMVCLPVSLFAA